MEGGGWRVEAWAGALHSAPHGASHGASHAASRAASHLGRVGDELVADESDSAAAAGEDACSAAAPIGVPGGHGILPERGVCHRGRGQIEDEGAAPRLGGM